MPYYSSERKAELLKMLGPPLNLMIAEVARREGVTEISLYTWRKRASAEGCVVVTDPKHPTQEVAADARTTTVRATPPNALSEHERQAIRAKAAVLLQRSVISEQCLREPLVLHSDNGTPMKLATLLSKMYELGITPSRGRPRVSNDNPYSEALFRTLKYCPQWPTKGFETLDAAGRWVHDFIRWYNHEHRHSRIRFVTLAERHRGQDPCPAPRTL